MYSSLLTPYSWFIPSPTFSFNNHVCFLYLWVCFCFVYRLTCILFQISHISGILLPFSAWLTPLSVICSSSIQDVANGDICLFSHGWIMFHPIYISHRLKPIISWWALGLSPCLGYCKLLLWTLGHKCFFKSEFSFSFLDIYPGVGLLVHMVALILVFKGTLNAN